MNRESGFIPASKIFIISALVYSLALIPILLIRKRSDPGDPGLINA
jgi:hypothetical protein